jgi:hypothetical protein
MPSRKPTAERALRLFAELVRDLRPGDDTLSAALAEHSPREVFELVLTVGFDKMLAQVVRRRASIPTAPRRGDSARARAAVGLPVTPWRRGGG